MKNPAHFHADEINFFKKKVKIEKIHIDIYHYPCIIFPQKGARVGNSADLISLHIFCTII